MSELVYDDGSLRIYRSLLDGSLEVAVNDEYYFPPERALRMCEALRSLLQQKG